MTEAPPIPNGYRRRDDGILEREGGFGRADRPEEAVMGYGPTRKLECIHHVYGGSFTGSLCGKPAKHDPDWQGNPTKCGVHSAAAIAKRKAKSEAKYEAWRAERNRKAAQHRLTAEALKIVRQIADGHNDPRALCAEWVKQWSETE